MVTFLDEAGVSGGTEDGADAVRLAPGHQRFAGEAAVGAQQNAHAWPADADLPDRVFAVPGPGRWCLNPLAGDGPGRRPD